MSKKISLSFISVMTLLVVNFFVLKVTVTKELGMTKIPVAKETLNPRQQIKLKDLSFIEVPKVFMNDSYYFTEQEVIDKFTDIRTIVPKNSLFYKELLFEEKDLPDYPSVLLNDQEVAFSMPTNIVKLSGNTIVQNQHVDLLLTIKQKNNVPIVDTLFEGVRVIAIKDKKGLDINDSNSNKVPSVVILALSKHDIKIARAALEVGEVELYAYAQKDKKNYKLNNESKVFGYVQSKQD